MPDFIKEIFDHFDSLFNTKRSQYDNNYQYQEAWKELEDFLENDRHKFYKEFQKKEDFFYGRKMTSREEILKHYANLKIPFTQDLEKVRKAYKKLMVEFHPDKFLEPDSKDLATKILFKINESYTKIVDFLKK